MKGGDADLKVSSEECIPRRVFDLVSGKYNGLWADHITSIYTEKFNEKLPLNWETVIASDENFSVERIIGNKCIIYPKPSCDEYLSVKSSSDNSEESAPSEASTSSTPSQIYSNVLNLPSDKFWNVYITHVQSTADIWIRLIGEEYSEKYENLATDMELHYMDDVASSHCCSSGISVGDLFVVKVDDSWHRVEVEEILPNEMVRCFFVDHGDASTYKISDLYSLEPEFSSLPFQAVQCKLLDLEDVSNMLIITNLLLQLAVGKTLVAEVVSKEEQPISVILYDTSTKDDVNINDVLTEAALRDIQSPKLKPGVTEVCLTHVTPTGDVFFQLNISVVSLLKKYVERAALDNKAVDNVELNKLYLARHSVDHKFYRAVITDVNVNTQDKPVPAFFVDYGIFDKVNLSEVVEIFQPFEVLSKIPHQAIKCKLHHVPLASDLEWNSEVAKRLLSLAHKEVSLLAKLIPGPYCGIPIVEVFKRLTDTNKLVSINQTLAVDCALFTKKGCRSAAKTEYANAEVAQADIPENKFFEVPKLLLPSIGEYCDIHITLAASPFNFIFQPWLGGEAFDQMMLDMHNYYGVQSEGKLLNTHLLRNGFYAVLHKSIWYRAHITVSDMLQQDGMVFVYFIDYGDHALINISHLRILKDDFRSLPSQALKGKLAGVVPKFGDWLPEDCLRFTELTVDKQFVADIRGYESSKDASEAPQIIMELVDTTVPGKDIYIHKILLEENRAELP